jgi:hypothetical protein
MGAATSGLVVAAARGEHRVEVAVAVEIGERDVVGVAALARARAARLR